jgi:hypothetical protein
MIFLDGLDQADEALSEPTMVGLVRDLSAVDRFVIIIQSRQQERYSMKAMNFVSSLRGLEAFPKQSKDTLYCECPIMAGKCGFQIASGIKGTRNDGKVVSCRTDG